MCTNTGKKYVKKYSWVVLRQLAASGLAAARQHSTLGCKQWNCDHHHCVDNLLLIITVIIAIIIIIIIIITVSTIISA